MLTQRGDEISQSGTVVVPFCVRMILSNLVDKRAEKCDIVDLMLVSLLFHDVSVQGGDRLDDFDGLTERAG